MDAEIEKIVKFIREQKWNSSEEPSIYQDAKIFQKLLASELAEAKKEIEEYKRLFNDVLKQRNEYIDNVNSLQSKIQELEKERDELRQADKHTYWKNEREKLLSELSSLKETNKRLQSGIEILKELCQLKHYKDDVGKDAFYEKRQPELWKQTNEFLNTLTDKQ
jgi:deoxyadenosine/deoxycytidine kinase